MRRLILSILTFCSFFGNAQSLHELERDTASGTYKCFDALHYRNQIEHSELYFKDTKEVHSSVKPIIINRSYSEKKSSLQFVKAWSKSNKKRTSSHYFSIAPLSDISAGAELSNKSQAVFSAGIGIAADYLSNKFFISGKFLPYYSSLGSLEDSIKSNYDQSFGTNRSFIDPNVFYRTELVAGYQVNKFFTFSGGLGKNFFGEGYRSLLLSDNGAAHPFLKIETTFAGIKYVNLYNAWKDNTTDPFNNKNDILKFSSLHYLSWNITRDINLSVFEAVVWQAKDTLTNRGFDLNYINPIVFYRPVEYGLGSSDNVLIGTNLSYKINKNHNIYTQFVLDEFLLSELKSNSKWWANKYGLQVGYKSNRFLFDNLYMQLEINGVRPFTYSHKSSAHAYGNLNASVTHPVGSNFLEVLNIVSYKKDKHRFTNKITYTSYGLDSDSTISNGQNIFLSYSLRDGNYDHLVMQGTRHNVFNETFIYEFELLPKIDLYLTAIYNLRSVNTSYGNQLFQTISIGVKSRIWNSYSDF